MKEIRMDRKGNCPMCNRTAQTFYGKWYQYDNGSRFHYLVCKECAALHGKLLKASK